MVGGKVEGVEVVEESHLVGGEVEGVEVVEERHFIGGKAKQEKSRNREMSTMVTGSHAIK